MHTKVSLIGRANSPAYPYSVPAYSVLASFPILSSFPGLGMRLILSFPGLGMRLNLSVFLVKWASADVLSFWWLEATLRLQGLLTLQALFYYQPSSPWTIPSHTLSLETSPETNPLPNPVMLYPTLVSGNTKYYETENRVKVITPQASPSAAM